MASAATRVLRDEPGWPGATASDPRVVFLIDASSALERRLLAAWIARHSPEDAPAAASLDIPASRRRSASGRGALRELEGCLAAEDDVLLAPLRVAWLARERDGRRSARFSDLLRLGDPRDPGWLRQHAVLRREPDRCRIVAGEPALASELRERWREAGGAGGTETGGLAEFVTRQAALALERAERRLRGARYKVPRLVEEEILDRPAFRGEHRPAGSRDRRERTESRACRTRRCAEAAARDRGHPQRVRDRPGRPPDSPALHPAAMASRCSTTGRAARTESIALAQRHPVVFLPTHKSNLDHLVLQYALHENELPHRTTPPPAST